MKNFAFIAILAVAFVVAGCAKPPQEEIEATQTALQTADAAEADIYVMELYQAAQDSFAAAQAEIEIQNAKNSLTRDYDRANALLASAMETATQAEQTVEDRKEEMRTNNEALFVTLEETLTNLGTLMAQAPRGKDGAMALAAIQVDVDLVRQSLETARTAQTEGDFLTANQIATQALQKAETLQTELETAIAGTGTSVRS